jgi:hypothetical protein
MLLSSRVAANRSGQPLDSSRLAIKKRSPNSTPYLNEVEPARGSLIAATPRTRSYGFRGNAKDAG